MVHQGHRTTRLPTGSGDARRQTATRNTDMSTTTTNRLANNQKLAPAARMIEQLEGRRLLSVSMQDGVVLVTGTDAADSVQILATSAGTQPMLTVEVWTGDSGTVANFPLSQVTGVKVDGLGGNDQLFVDRTSSDVDLTVPVTLFGGEGDDVLVGGGGVDELVGGSGNDWIDAGNGAWLESSDQWIARSDADNAAAPKVDGEHPAVGDDHLALDSGADHLDGAGADRLMPAQPAPDDSATVNNTLFSDNPVQDDAAVWNV